MTTRTHQRKTHTLRKIAGDVVLPADAAYDANRTVWNAMIDRCPAVIVRCAEDTDVVHAIAFARAQQLEIAIRRGGRNIAGSAACDGGLVIDMSRMNVIVVDPRRRRATIQAGATLAQMDAATQAHGLATPPAINSTTGFAGLTLGGGFGWLTRRYGMTIDNLVGAEIVTVDGVTRRASEREHPDLFWAIRGGGGNFGVVTRFEVVLHAVGPEVLAGLIVFPFERAKDVLQGYCTFITSAPEELSVWVVLRKAPPLPFLPASVVGRDVLALAACHTGPLDEARRAMAPLHDMARVTDRTSVPSPTSPGSRRSIRCSRRAPGIIGSRTTLRR